MCFHRWLSGDPVKLTLCTTGLVEPLESTNQNWCGVRLLPMSVSTYPVDCVHLCHLLKAQHHCLCPNGREGTIRLAYPLPYMRHCDITGIVKTISKTSSKYCAAEFAMKH